MNFAFLLPDDFDAATGGFAYARRVIAGFAARGDLLQIHKLSGEYPNPDRVARAQARRVLGELSDGQTTLIDGLALGALAEEVGEHAQRLDLVALVHHPLFRETGLAAQRQQQLFDSERAALSHCRCVIATSRATAYALIADFGMRPDRLYVAPPGTVRREPVSGSGQSTLQLLCLASVVPRKGHLVLLDALAGLSSLGWHLHCVGSLERDRSHVERVRRRIDEQGLADRVSLLGELDEAALSARWQGTDLFVLATFHEGYGMAFAEALAAGLPIIGTTAAAVPELFNGAARLVAPGDAGALRVVLAELVGDQTARRRLGQAALRAARELPSWSDTVMMLQRALAGSAAYRL